MAGREAEALSAARAIPAPRRTPSSRAPYLGGVAAGAFAVLAAAACSKTEEPKRDPSATTATATATGSGAPTPSGFSMMLPQNQLRFVAAPKAGDVAALVRDESEKQKALGRRLLVYVGATWCEPCKTFHHAAAKGELDGSFPDLTLLEFDADADGERLRAAGYTSRYIPLFALPSADGRASGKIIEGSVKGDRAVADITPRLRGLLADAR